MGNLNEVEGVDWFVARVSRSLMGNLNLKWESFETLTGKLAIPHGEFEHHIRFAIEMAPRLAIPHGEFEPRFPVPGGRFRYSRDPSWGI